MGTNLTPAALFPFSPPLTLPPLSGEFVFHFLPFQGRTKEGFPLFSPPLRGRIKEGVSAWAASF